MFACLNYPKAKYSVRSHQAGAVLILALLIVAMVAGLGIKFAGDYQLGLARAEGRWHGAQARAYGYSAESAAIYMLSKDDPSYDAPDELWHTEFPIEVEGGNLLITISDASAQLNLNGLIAPLDPNKGPEDPTRYTLASQRMFIRLLRTFPELVHSSAEAAGILEAIVDWTDQDNAPSGLYGAEEDYYLSRPDPYRPANAPFRSVEELQMIRGVSPALMAALRPYITVLATVSQLNVNTMDTRMFRTINTVNNLDPLDESQAAALQQAAPKAGHYMQPGDFDQTWKAVFGATDYDKSFLTVKTDFFWLVTLAQIGEQRRTARSLLKRSPQGFTVVQREEGNNIEFVMQSPRN